jgi:hypothetical protein
MKTAAASALVVEASLGEQASSDAASADFFDL